MESYTINLLKDIASHLAKSWGLGFTAAHWIINTKDDNFRRGEIVASSSTQTHNNVGWVPGLEGWNCRFQFQLVKTESKSNLIFETGSGTKTRFSVF
jgi:hypothetical protein